MTHLTQLEIANWIALYVAAGLCCFIAILLSVTTAAVQIYQQRAWGDIRSLKELLLFIPRSWWRWQKLYLLSTPVTLAIVSSFAATLRWA